MAIEYNSGFSDDESANNNPNRSTFIYKDFSLAFTRNPVTGDVATIKDVQDIKRSVRNLVMMNPGDKPFHPEIGTGIRAALFQNFSPTMSEALRLRIENTLKIYEPRITVREVSFRDPDSQSLDNNELNCFIIFTLNNAPEQLEQVSLMLQRIR
jgi:hypothetical protein